VSCMCVCVCVCVYIIHICVGSLSTIIIIIISIGLFRLSKTIYYKQAVVEVSSIYVYTTILYILFVELFAFVSSSSVFLYTAVRRAQQFFPCVLA
jgi:hypothetical protein